MYDYRRPLEDVPASLLRSFDAVVIDPPFVSASVWKMYAETARGLLRYDPIATSSVPFVGIRGEGGEGGDLRDDDDDGIDDGGSREEEEEEEERSENMTTATTATVGGAETAGKGGLQQKQRRRRLRREPIRRRRSSSSGDGSGGGGDSDSSCDNIQTQRRSLVLGTTLPENADALREILGSDFIPREFSPSIPNLVYQYGTFANFDCPSLSEINRELYVE